MSRVATTVAGGTREVRLVEGFGCTTAGAKVFLFMSGCGEEEKALLLRSPRDR
jgi:hypothetical protein